MNYRNADGSWDDISIDKNTGAQNFIDYDHHELHDGNHYTYTEIASLGDAGELEILITTPNTEKWAHMVFEVVGALHTTIEAFETCTHVAGTAKTPYNNNRNSTNTPGVTLAANGGTGADGTLIFTSQFGIDAGGGANRIRSGGTARGDSEWILKQNTKYLLTITSLTAANQIAVRLSWYEHTNRV
jgi:hypothetical protein